MEKESFADPSYGKNSDCPWPYLSDAGAYFSFLSGFVKMAREITRRLFLSRFQLFVPFSDGNFDTCKPDFIFDLLAP
jgi:hypothetical protein